MNDQLTTYLRGIEQAIGVELWYVGGCVRDELIGVPCNDIDLIALGLPQDELNEALSKFGKVDVTGAVFGVTRFRPSDRSLPMLEISLPRKEVSTGAGHKDFVVEFDHTLPLEDDLQRRDFTVNSFAKSVATGEIRSVEGASDDLDYNALRFISDTSAQDDPLRILRAVRFVSKLGFMPTTDTEKQLVDNVELLANVSAERIQEELLKIVVGRYVDTALRFAQNIGVLRILIPELETCVGVEQNHYHSLTVFEHIVEVVKHTPSTDPIVKLAALFHDIAKPPTKWTGDDGVNHFYHAEPGQKFLVEPEIHGNHEDVGADISRDIMNRLRFSSQNVDRVYALVKNHMFIQGDNLRRPAARRLLARFAHVPGGLGENIDALFAIRTGDIYGGKVDKVNQAYLDLNDQFYRVVKKEIELETAFKVTDLAINGGDLINLGLTPGPHFSRILKGLLDDVIENPDLNDRDVLLDRVRNTVGVV